MIFPTKRHWTLFTFIVLASSTLVAADARAQEQAEEETSLRPRGLSFASWDILKDKRRAAREGRWSAMVVLSEELGYSSNIFASPSTDGTVTGLPVGSAVVNSGAQLEVYRYFDRMNRLTLGARLDDSRYMEDADLDRTYIDASAEFEHAFSGSTQAFAGAEVSHENDNAVDIYGDPFTRDFAYATIEGDAGIEHSFNNSHKIEIAYSGKKKNYGEVSTLNSLDWVRHGPRVHYTLSKGPTRFRLWYGFAAQNYAEEPASNADGSEPSTNPAEEHFHHHAMLWMSRDLAPEVELDLRLEYDGKDDRFEGYESYHEVEFSADLAWRITRALSAQMRAGISTADYDHRPAEDAGEPLALDYRGGGVTLLYEASRHVAVFGRYSLVDRASNRDTGSSYMDYRVSGAGAGVSVAF